MGTLQTIQLPIRAKHFDNADFGDPWNCPIAHAANEYFDIIDASEGVDYIDIGESRWKHPDYTSEMFIDHKEQVAKMSPEEIVFILPLSEVI